MADKKDAKKGAPPKSDPDAMGTIIGILAGILIIAGLVNGIERWLGVSFDAFSFEQVSERFSGELTEDTPIGTLVETRGETDIWATVTRASLLGIQQGGAVGRIIDGPVFLEEEQWWRVDFEEVPDGWTEQGDLRLLGGGFARFRRIYTIIAWIVSLLALAGAMYAMYRYNVVTQTHRQQMKILEAKIAGVGVSERNDKWDHVTTLVASDNPGDWRVAIVEADIMLDLLLTKMGHVGESLGDKLKQIEKSDFATLDMAWDAHKIRNRVTHHGSDFILTHREAKRVIDLYREVFNEFDYI